MPFRRRRKHQQPGGADESEPSDGSGKWGRRTGRFVQFGEIVQNAVDGNYVAAGQSAGGMALTALADKADELNSSGRQTDGKRKSSWRSKLRRFRRSDKVGTKSEVEVEKDEQDPEEFASLFEGIEVSRKSRDAKKTEKGQASEHLVADNSHASGGSGFYETTSYTPASVLYANGAASEGYIPSPANQLVASVKRSTPPSSRDDDQPVFGSTGQSKAKDTEDESGQAEGDEDTQNRLPFEDTEDQSEQGGRSQTVSAILGISTSPGSS